MKRCSAAFKGWESCMDGFSSEECIRQGTTLQFTPECDGAGDILWSSSSEEESSKGKKRKKVVTRLNFDECLSHSSGQATPLYSRHLEDVKAADRESTCKQSLVKRIYDSFNSPEKENPLLPADVNLPSSPVIMRRKRRRSLNDTPVSPVIERKFMRKLKKVSPNVVNSPSNFVKYRLERKLSLDASMSSSSADMITPLKEDNCQPTGITPTLENMNLNSLEVKSKNKLITEVQQPIMITTLTSPLKEVASSQDILEITESDDLDYIKEPNDSQADVQIGMENDGLPLSAIITMSASPSITADSIQENGDDNFNPSSALLPLSMETPHKNAFASVEDPESGGKRKRLKKGGLAVRLQRLLNREQSWQRMWQHEQLRKSNSNSDICLALSVASLWSEASKILVQCRVKSKPKLSKGQFVTEHTILLLEPMTIGERGIKPGCIIRIHPPWQSLLINSCTTLLMGANLMEMVPSSESQHSIKSFERKVFTKTYTCHCIHGESCINYDKECPFRLELGGLEFLSKFMPALIGDSCGKDKKEHLEPQMLLTQLPPASVDDTKHFGSEQKRQGTISQVVAAHSQRDGSAVCGLSLIGVVQRVFCYRAVQQSSLSTRKSLSLGKNITKRWSALLQDAAGEFCEVEFESQPETLSLDQPILQGDLSEGPWWGITYVGTLLCEGAVLCISGLRILKRSEGNRPRGLSGVMNAIHNERRVHSVEEGVTDSRDERIPSGQLFVYTFSYQKGGSIKTLNETTFQLPAWSQPLVQTLYDALQEWKRKDLASRSSEGHRVTVLVKLLFAKTINQDCPWHLFVSDPSLSALNCKQEILLPWVPVTIKSTCYISPLLASMLFHPFSSASVPVLCFQDVELCGGELICDRFSHVHVDGGQSSLPSWMAGHTNAMAFIHSSPLPRVSPLNPNSMPGEVVSVVGNVVGVDEETAYSWPACTFCGNDHLSKAQLPSTSKQQPIYYCFQCKTSVEKPLNKMSLDAYIACNSLPPECCRIKIKMCQKSIADLLPKKEGKMGYELTSVLGKLIGPLFCVLVSTCKSLQLRQRDDAKFVLEELSCFVNMQ